jgi:hypothetical protein
LKTQHMFHPLPPNAIKFKAFKFRAQAIFSLSEKKHPPGLHNLSSSIFFHYQSTLCRYSRNIYIYITKTWYHELFCEIESNFKSGQFFYIYTLYIVYTTSDSDIVFIGFECKEEMLCIWGLITWGVSSG